MKKMIFAIFMMLVVMTLSSGAAITFEISELPDGKTHWELLGSDTIFKVDMWSPTGLQGEQIILPKRAFDFDYSQSFRINFDNSIGKIKNLKSGASVSLDSIAYYKFLDRLEITGSGLLDRSTGDQLQITDFSSANINIAFTDIVAKNQTAYLQNGAWYTDYQVTIIPQAIPEPASALMILFGSSIIGLIRRFYGDGIGRRI